MFFLFVPLIPLVLIFKLGFGALVGVVVKGSSPSFGNLLGMALLNQATGGFAAMIKAAYYGGIILTRMGMVLVVFILKLLGFGPLGVIKGNSPSLGNPLGMAPLIQAADGFAATIQAEYYGGDIPAGGLFAILTKMGMVLAS